jgi:hypothetical protein
VQTPQQHLQPSNMSIFLYRTVGTTIEALQGVTEARPADSTATSPINLKKVNSSHHHPEMIATPHQAITAAILHSVSSLLSLPSMAEAAAALMRPAGARVLWGPHTLLQAIMTADKVGQQSVLAHRSNEIAAGTGHRVPVAALSKRTTSLAGNLRRVEAAAGTPT